MVKFDFLQGQVVPQRDTAKKLVRKTINRQLQQTIKRAHSQLKHYISQIHFNEFFHEGHGKYYFTPVRSMLDLNNLPRGFRHVVVDDTTEFIEETIGDKHVYYRILYTRSHVRRIPKEANVSHFIVFYRESKEHPIVFANEKYSTWILPVNEDFTIFRGKQSHAHLYDEHLGVTYFLFRPPPIQSQKPKRQLQQQKS